MISALRRHRHRNPDPEHGPHSACSVFRWMIVEPLLGRRRVEPAGAPAPRVEVDAERIRRPAAGVRTTWLGHSSFLVSLAGRSLLVDPVFSRRIAAVVRRHGRPPLPLEELPGALPELSAILVTHNHYDHLDTASLRALPAAVPAVAPRGLGRWLERRHRRPVLELEWWQTIELDGLEITLVPSRHWSRRWLFDTNRTLWGGYVVHRRGRSIYHAGDSAWFDGFAEIGRRFPAIDVAMLPIGGYTPAWFMERQHMNPVQAVCALGALGARWMVPMHWGAFQLTDEPIAAPAAWLRRCWDGEAPGGSQLALLAVGESLEVAPTGGRSADREADLRSAAADRSAAATG